MSQKLIQNLVEEIAELTGSVCSQDKAISIGLDHFLTYEYSAQYGGYRLINVKVKGGGRFGTILGNGTMPRQKAKVFILMLEACIAGLRYGK